MITCSGLALCHPTLPHRVVGGELRRAFLQSRVDVLHFVVRHRQLFGVARIGRRFGFGRLLGLREEGLPIVAT
jgi:hypothetical protein